MGVPRKRGRSGKKAARPSSKNSAKTKAWREFEKLVAHIEAVAAPRGAKVKSPDRIRDLVTGKLRQIDASLRYAVGTVDILIIFEARKRGKVQDDTWIEQLGIKRQKVGAAKAVAVSNVGFSDSAPKTAELYGIELRTLSEIDPSTIEGWLTIERFVFRGLTSSLVSFRQILYAAGASRKTVSLLPATHQALERNGAQACVWTALPRGTRVSISDLIARALHEDPALFRAVPVDGSVFPIQLRLNFPRGVLSIETDGGSRDVFRMDLGVEFSYSQQEAPLTQTRSYLYEGSPGISIERTEYRTTLEGTPLAMAHQFNRETRLLTLSIRSLNQEAR